MNYDLSKMTPKDLEKLIKFLQNTLGEKYEDKSTISKVINQEMGIVECPCCHEKNNIIKKGFTETRIQRYKCKNCGKKFCDTANTVCHHSKLNFEKWKVFFECMSDKLSIRKTAAKMDVNKNTVFAMRHKVLNALSVFRENVEFKGKVEADEITTPINFKGLNQDVMPRSSKKRKSASKKVNHKACILGAIDEHDNQFLELVDYGEITTEDIENCLGSRLSNATYLITDCKSAYERVAKKHNLILEQIKSNTYKNENGFTLAEVNGLHSNFFRFMSSFRGVSIKHLQGYIDWFLYQRYIDYAVEIINHPTEMLYYVLKQKRSITIREIYNASYPFDIKQAYSDYLEVH